MKEKKRKHYTMRKPCGSPSNSTKATGSPFSFMALYIFVVCSGDTTCGAMKLVDIHIALDKLNSLILKHLHDNNEDNTWVSQPEQFLF